MKWIKASERLPDTGVGILNYVWTRNVQTKCGGMVTLDSLLKMKGSDNVEWLDESSQFTQAAGAEVETGKNKPFIVANVREMLHDHWTGKISFSRMVELFNEVAERFYASSTTDDKGYSREQMEQYGKSILQSISDTFLKPENINMADKQSDKDVFIALGRSIKNFPLPSLPTPLTDEWVDVRERLPEIPPPYKDGESTITPLSVRVMVFDGEDVYEYHYSKGDSLDGITHWQYRPAPPSQKH